MRVAGPLTTGLRGFVDDQVTAFLASDTFQRLWVAINERGSLGPEAAGVIGAFELAVQGIADLAPSAATTGTGISSREGV